MGPNPPRSCLNKRSSASAAAPDGGSRDPAPKRKAGDPEAPAAVAAAAVAESTPAKRQRLDDAETKVMLDEVLLLCVA